MTTAPRWRKSSYSGQDAGCVEIADSLDAVRDSKNPTGPALVFQPPAFAAFCEAVKDGRLDS